MNKSELLAKLLVKYDDIKKYVILKEDISGKYFKYAFCDGYPENCYKLPLWAGELELDKIYKLSGWMGDHWAICGSQPTDVDRLMKEKYQLSAEDIFELMEES